MTGCLLLNKNPGTSSFDSLRPIKKALGTGKVCHTGTLDTFADGLLVILTGQAVKLSAWFTGCDKRYLALVRFGEETDTLDPEGKMIATAPLPQRSDVEAALPAFTGEIMQAPPIFSAIHVNGKRAHELARAGIETEMKKRPVTIHSLSLRSWDPPHAELEVHCSSGTYIRSLARDMALAVGSRAHLRTLRRTQVGNFSLDNALSLPSGKFEASAGNTNGDAGNTGAGDTGADHTDSGQPLPVELIRAAVQPLSPELFARLGIPGISIDEKTTRAVSHGGDLNFLRRSIPGLENHSVAALFGPVSFACLVERRDDKWRYGCVFAAD